MQAGSWEEGLGSYLSLQWQVNTEELGLDLVIMVARPWDAGSRVSKSQSLRSRKALV